MQQQTALQDDTKQLASYSFMKLSVRGLKICAPVGSVLLAINHGETIRAGSWPEAWRILLNYLVPFLVSTLSSYALLRQTPSIKSGASRAKQNL